MKHEFLKEVVDEFNKVQPGLGCKSIRITNKEALSVRLNYLITHNFFTTYLCSVSP
jgi:hypothetical protein